MVAVSAIIVIKTIEMIIDRIVVIFVAFRAIIITREDWITG